MKSCAIICEYNPFHIGHRYHINQTKAQIDADVYIGIMSNHFVQRGDIARVNALERAKATGFDLIIELPYPYVLEAADKYAEGAIKVAKALKVDYLSFGSEIGSVEELNRLALQELSVDQTASLASSSPVNNGNDILGIAYLKQLIETSITPITVKRMANVSATKIRAAKKNGEDITSVTNLSDFMTNPTIEDFYPYLRNLIITLPQEYLASIFLMDEGIENLFKKQAMVCEAYEDFLNACTSKRYTHARINRTLIHLMLQTTKEQAAFMEDNAPCRLLYANKTGFQYLNNRSINVVSNFKSLPQFYIDYLMKAEALIHELNPDDLKIEMSYPKINI